MEVIGEQLELQHQIVGITRLRPADELFDHRLEHFRAQLTVRLLPLSDELRIQADVALDVVALLLPRRKEIPDDRYGDGNDRNLRPLDASRRGGGGPTRCFWFSGGWHRHCLRSSG